MTVLVRKEPEQNMDRNYTVLIQPTLFEPLAVICLWGNRKTAWQRMRVLPVESAAEAKALAEKVVERKIRRGYRCIRVE